MHEIRNSDGRLVCRIDEIARVIEIYSKGCLTRIQWTPDGKLHISHARSKSLAA
ncbi:MAG: hypothetical protein LBJ11_05595 [Oscillospiraceae bacterium]|jgi:hypothetical protein|nr:hypothetical protein [Oscillospiraceae bacterium]